jgi:ribonuclease HI
MPIWFHTSKSQYMRQITNRKGTKCLCLKHGIKTTGQVKELTTRNDDHKERALCQCQMCRDCRGKGCRNPAACRNIALRILASLPLEWQPCSQEEGMDLKLSEDNIQRNKTALTKGEDMVYKRNITIEEILEAIRIFTKKRKRVYTQPEMMTIETPERQVNTVWTASRSRPGGQENTVTAAAIWFGDNDERNEAFLVEGRHASKQRGEAIAIAEALRTAPKNQPLWIVSQNKQYIEYITTKLNEMERKGWLNVKHGDVLRTAMEWAKWWTAKTYFCAKKIAKSGRPEAAIYKEIEMCLESGTTSMIEPTKEPNTS